MREFVALPLEFVDVDADAGELHFGQHADERPFEVPVQLGEAFGLEPFVDDVGQFEGDLGVFGGVFGRLGDVDLEHLELLLPGADRAR